MTVLLGNDPSIRWCGRYAVLPDGSAVTGWPCVSGELKWKQNTPGSVSLQLAGKGNCVRLWLDNTVFDLSILTETPFAWTSPTLSHGSHRLLWSRINHDAHLTMRWMQIHLEGGSPIPPAPRQAPLLFVGDSWSAGYGNCCPGNCADTEEAISQHSDCWQAFPAQIAQALNKPFEVFALSGHGVVKNYGDTPPSPAPLAQYWPYALPQLQAPLWVNDAEAPPPSHVIIVLGENDFSTLPHPTSEQFLSAAEALLTLVRTSAPEAPIFWGVPSNRAQLATQVTSLAHHIPNFRAVVLPPIQEDFPWGCRWHPSQAHHRVLCRAWQEYLIMLD